jgi:hypothetical protein
MFTANISNFLFILLLSIHLIRYAPYLKFLDHQFWRDPVPRCLDPLHSSSTLGLYIVPAGVRTLPLPEAVWNSTVPNNLL